jgi:hypothetical protein
MRLRHMRDLQEEGTFQRASIGILVDLLLQNTLHFYGLPVQPCPSGDTQPPGALALMKVSFPALVSASAQTICVPFKKRRSCVFATA